ncbi:dihydrofolate reductase [Rhodocytophaga rosea]|uniref:Dihydrofolate reductase n=1 Tax=Rhodocytophaga rosea TaxID=2704465 RepID=A0A6C0GDN3_9BACT|nr:dihydrofolate reductase family protein [Rhodocytophaga rosea]QHT65913.1 dihydrofolate reductase [Rhodocytophaga rosea]
MRKLIVSMNVTLDGFLSGPDCELDWHFQRWTSDMAECACEQLSKADTILLGRVTYNAMARYWTAKLHDLSFPREDLAFADMMHRYTKFVFSHTSQIPPWNNAIRIKGNLAAAIVQLKQQPGKDMIMYGSASIVAVLMSMNLVDEYQVWVHPVVLGKGKALFKNVSRQLDLQLYKTHIFRSGVAMLCYNANKQVDTYLRLVNA